MDALLNFTKEPEPEELDIIDCLEDYCRILINTAANVSGSVGSRKRAVANLRAQQVNALIDRLKALEVEETH